MKIAFTDFWLDFDPENNFFTDLFRAIYGNVHVSHPSDSDILFFGPYSQTHLHFQREGLVKIFYTGENERPNFTWCNYSLTFDFDDYEGRNVRLPLWFLQLDWFNKKTYKNPEFVLPLEEVENNKYIESNYEEKRLCTE